MKKYEVLVVASYPGNAIVEVWAEDEEHALELAMDRYEAGDVDIEADLSAEPSVEATEATEVKP